MLLGRLDVIRVDVLF